MQDEQRILFQEIIEQHKGILWKVAKTYCQDETDRQDLMQEMLVHIWQALPTYNYHFKLSTWLYRIALNVAISFYRKNLGRQGKTFALPEQTPYIHDTEPEKVEQLQMLEAFIQGLKELDKALMLLYLEDKSHAEIADILGISVSNVGTKISRIKEKLKQHFSIQKKN